jgi:hypothetical protein
VGTGPRGGLGSAGGCLTQSCLRPAPPPCAVQAKALLPELLSLLKSAKLAESESARGGESQHRPPSLLPSPHTS